MILTAAMLLLTEIFPMVTLCWGIPLMMLTVMQVRIKILISMAELRV